MEHFPLALNIDTHLLSMRLGFTIDAMLGVVFLLMM